jgi:hypothetical protein
MAMTSVVMEELQEQLFAQAEELNTREEAIVMWAHAKTEAV